MNIFKKIFNAHLPTDALPTVLSSFIMKTTPHGTFGVFKDYPSAEGVLREIMEVQAHITPDTRFLGYPRLIFFLKILIDGNPLKIVVKGKPTNNCTDGFSQEKYPCMLDLQHGSLTSIDSQRRQFSVLNELLSNRTASKRYQEKFKRTLLIEKPIGFFISQRSEDRGARWTFFEQIEGIIRDIPDNQKYALEQKEGKFRYQIRNELKEIGIITKSLKFNYDVVPVGTIENPVFYLLDSEEWQVI